MHCYNVLLIHTSEPSDIVTCLREIGTTTYSIHPTLDPVENLDEYDLVVCDLDEKNGFHSLEHLHSEERSVVVIGTQESREHALSYLDNGADDILIRPFDPFEAKLRLTNLLKKRHRNKINPHVERQISNRDLLDLSRNIMLTLKQDIITFANSQASQTLGWKPKELKGYPLSEIVHPEALDHIEELLPEIAESGERLPIQWLTKSGKVIESHITATPVQEEGPGSYLIEAVDLSEQQRNLESLLQRERRYRSLVELSSNLVMIITDGVITFTNPTCDKSLGATGSPYDLIGRPLASIVATDYIPIVDGGLEEIAEMGERLPLKFLSLSGKLLDVNIGVARLKDSHEETYLLEAVDVSQQKRSAEALLEREEHLSGIVNNAPDAIITTDEQGLIESFNHSAEKIFGYTKEEAIGQDLCNFIKLPSKDPKIRECTAKEAIGLRKDNTRIDIDISVKSMIFGEHQRFVAIMRDITIQKRDHEELAFLATHDPLTKLPNSHFILKTLERLTDNTAKWVPCSVLFITLERLNRVNDLFGHQVVDQVLASVAERLNQSIGQYNIIGRWGGGKFVAIINELSRTEIASTICREIIDILSPAFQIGDNEIVIGCTIGISCFPEDCDSPSSLVKNAGMAAFAAHQEENTVFKFYSKEMEAEAEERDMLERELRLALAQNQLDVYYQPKIDLSTGYITGMEALVRWIHPDLGFISPVKFIPIAEETGQIVGIGEWILKRACLDTCKWSSQGLVDLKVAVNLSGRQFDDENLQGRVKEILDETGLSPQNLELEVTESSLMRDIDKGMRTLKSLRDLGITTAIDDFGTGYSSLSYLRRIPLDTLKIDQSFVRNLHVDPDDAAIARTIMDMAENLGLKVVAEGIEIKEHETFLKSIHCHIGQGYYYSKPVPAQKFEKLLLDLSPPAKELQERRKGYDRRKKMDRRHI